MADLVMLYVYGTLLFFVCVNKLVFCIFVNPFTPTCTARLSPELQIPLPYGGGVEVTREVSPAVSCYTNL